MVITEDLKNYFADFGMVVGHHIRLDQSGRSRGFGFVSFDSEDVVKEVLAPGKVHKLRGEQVSNSLYFSSLNIYGCDDQSFS